MSRRKTRRNKEKKLTRERIEILFGEADKAALEGKLGKANEYVGMARKIAMKSNVRIPREYKRKFCKFCYHYLMPGKTSRTRTNSGQKRIETKCFNCGKTIYFPLYQTKNKKQVKEDG